MITPLELSTLFSNKEIKWITSGDDTQYCFIKKEGENILLFAPSNSKADWKNNFAFFKKPYKQMKTKFYVHGGFLKCWKLVEDEIIDYIKENKFDNLTISGWSYGGAISVLCSESVWFNCKSLRGKTRTITFGAPRVISIFNFKKIKERFENIIMFKNGSDPVPKLPFGIMGFKHVDSIMNIGETPNLINYFNPVKYHSMKHQDKYGYYFVLEKVNYGLNKKQDK